MSQEVFESFLVLLKKLSYFGDNKLQCDEIRGTYRPYVDASSKRATEKKRQLNEEVEALYAKYSEDICDRDFTFLRDDNVSLLGHELAPLLKAMYLSDDDKRVTETSNEILYLFFHVMPADKKEEIKKKYAQKSPQTVAKIPEKPSQSPPDTLDFSALSGLGGAIEKTMKKNAKKLENANPNDFSEIISSITSDMFSELQRNMGK